MTYWKYKHETFSNFGSDEELIGWLNEQGKQGWQLISVDNVKYLFKKEISHRETQTK
jgi:hypothetical protein